VAANSKDFVILACVVLTQYRSVTDGRARSTMAKTRLALRDVVRKNRKMLHGQWRI